MKLVAARFDHPDARKLNDRVQAEYAVRYGDAGDLTHLAPEMFDPPAGVYVLLYDADGTPLGTGGWRSHDEDSLAEGYALGDAEIKRMYGDTGVPDSGAMSDWFLQRSFGVRFEWARAR